MARGEEEDSNKEESLPPSLLPSFLPQERSLCMSCALTLCVCPLLKLELKLNMIKEGIAKEKESHEEAVARRGKKRKQLEDPSMEPNSSSEVQNVELKSQRSPIRVSKTPRIHQKNSLPEKKMKADCTLPPPTVPGHYLRTFSDPILPPTTSEPPPPPPQVTKGSKKTMAPQKVAMDITGPKHNITVQIKCPPSPLTSRLGPKNSSLGLSIPPPCSITSPSPPITPENLKKES